MIFNLSGRLMLASVLISLVACQSKPVSNPRLGPGDELTAPTPKHGEVTPAPSTSIPSPVPPSVRETPKRVAVILGPGGAKTFAEIGVLKALQKQRVPVSKVVGLEWGSLIGALYANKGQVNDLEWKLYKMEQQNLPRPKGGFFRRGEDTIKLMDDFLNESFGRDEVTKAKISFDCPARSLANGSVTWQSHGFFKDVIHRCLAYPPTFRVEGGFAAGASLASEAVEQLSREGYNLIILVNVLGSAMPVGQDALHDNGEHVILWQEVKRALTLAARLNVETISIDTSAYPILQYESLKDLRALGESAGQAPIAALINKYGF